MTSRRSLARAAATIAVAVMLVATIAGCGGGSSAQRTSRSSSASQSSTTTHAPAPLAVRPSPARSSSEIAFGFAAPAASGVHGASELSYSVSITGPSGAGCTGVREAPVGRAAKGEQVTVTVGPAELGTHWCRGAYTARAFELERAHCTGRAPCPQYIRVIGIVARAAFRVAAG